MIHIHRETCEAKATLDWSHGDGQETWITFSTGIRCGWVIITLSVQNLADYQAFGLCSFCNTVHRKIILKQGSSCVNIIMHGSGNLHMDPL